MSRKSGKFATTVTLPSSPPEASTEPTAQLAVVHPPELARRIPLPRAVTVLGREPGSSLGRLPEGTVSRRHLGISWDPSLKTHVAGDLGSHNGSWLNGAALAESAVSLEDGSVLRMGSVIAVYEEVREPVKDEDPEPLRIIPGGSPRMKVLRHRIALTAPDPSPVLVHGETGVGKEHVVRAIHDLSGRRGRLVAVNVSELSPQLAESQLFGHAKGAFTGAATAQAGLFRDADGGTMFLDEIGELSIDLQPKLLRVIQEQEVRPVGSTRSVKIDIRVVAATNRDLSAEIEEGTFRRDLWARLSLFELPIPALSLRRADIPGWVALMHDRWRQERNRDSDPDLRFRARALEAILLREWPDNLRGIDRLVHRLAAVNDGGPVSRSALAEHIELPPRGVEAVIPTSEAPPKLEAKKEKPLVIKRPAPTTAEELTDVLARFDGSVRRAAKWYGRHRRQIYRWMNALGVNREDIPG